MLVQGSTCGEYSSTYAGFFHKENVRVVGLEDFGHYTVKNLRQFQDLIAWTDKAGLSIIVLTCIDRFGSI